MRMVKRALAAGLSIAVTSVSAQTQQDIEAEEPADVTIPRGEIVEPADPGEGVSRKDTLEAEGTGPDPSLVMFDDMQAVIDSVRSKTPMPEEPLAHLDGQKEVHVLAVSELPGQDAYHAQTLDEVLRDDHEAIAAIRDEIGLNIYAVRALNGAGFSPDDVLTWETAGTDDVTIVVDDRASG